MPPGMTHLPVASTTVSAADVEVDADQGDLIAVDEDVRPGHGIGIDDGSALDEGAHPFLLQEESARAVRGRWGPGRRGRGLVRWMPHATRA